MLVIHPRALRAHRRHRPGRAAPPPGSRALTAEIPDAEEGKHIEVASFCWQVLGQDDFTRSDAVVAVGGGAVTDLAGFVAATWLRGVKVIHMPTTPAGHGGRRRRRQDRHQHRRGQEPGRRVPPAGRCPRDLDTLDTLPQNEIISGMAEVIKCGFIADPAILDLIEEDPSAVADPPLGRPARTDRTRHRREGAGRRPRTCKETGLREILNYGHTLGHAIELAERYPGATAPPSPSA